MAIIQKTFELSKIFSHYHKFFFNILKSLFYGNVFTKKALNFDFSVKVKKLGKKLGLSEDFIKNLLQLVHKESIQKQTEVMNKIATTKKKPE